MNAGWYYVSTAEAEASKNGDGSLRLIPRGIYQGPTLRLLVLRSGPLDTDAFGREVADLLETFSHVPPAIRVQIQKDAKAAAAERETETPS